MAVPKLDLQTPGRSSGSLAFAAQTAAEKRTLVDFIFTRSIAKNPSNAHSLPHAVASNRIFAGLCRSTGIALGLPLASKGAFPRGDRSTTINRLPARHWDNLRNGVMLHGGRFIIRRYTGNPLMPDTLQGEDWRSLALE